MVPSPNNSICNFTASKKIQNIESLNWAPICYLWLVFIDLTLVWSIHHSKSKEFPECMDAEWYLRAKTKFCSLAGRLRESWQLLPHPARTPVRLLHFNADIQNLSVTTWLPRSSCFMRFSALSGSGTSAVGPGRCCLGSASGSCRVRSGRCSAGTRCCRAPSHLQVRALAIGTRYRRIGR